MDLPRNTIFVAEGEEIVSILERIHASSYRELFVVIPAGAVVGRSALNLKMLKREAGQHDKTLRVVAQDRGLQQLAEGLGIAWEGDTTRFWESIDVTALRSHQRERAVVSDIVAPPVETVVETQLREHDVPSISEQEQESESKEELSGEATGEAIEERPDVITRLYHRQEQSANNQDATADEQSDTRRSWMVLSIFVVAAVLLFAGVASAVLPRADVMITPRSEVVPVELNIVGDTATSAIQPEENRIPAQLFRVTQRIEKEFPATGTRNIQEHARGTITIYNQFSSQPQTLVQTTRFLSESGKIFRTERTVVVPGAIVESGKIIPSSIDVAVRAADPGVEYNIGPSRFTIPGFEGTPKHEGFYGESTKLMTGGTIGTISVVSESDINGAMMLVQEDLRAAVSQELEQTTPGHLTVPPEAQEITVLTEEVSHAAAEPGETFTVAAEMEGRVLAFQRSDVEALVQDRLEQTLPAQRETRPDTLSLSYTLETKDFENGRVAVRVTAEETIAMRVDTTAIREELRSRDEAGVRALLTTMSEIASVEVTFWPFWVNRIPDNPDRITVTVQ